MPIFDFTCSKCHVVTEKITSSSTKEIVCPECQGTAYKQEVSGAASFVLKGDGWYKPSWSPPEVT